MTAGLLEQLKAIDPAVLTEVVRKDQRDPHLAILDWTVRPLNPENLGLSNGGLFHFSGRSSGAAGIRPWRVVLKWIHHANQDSRQQREWTYSKREILAFKSGMLDRLPPERSDLASDCRSDHYRRKRSVKLLGALPLPPLSPLPFLLLFLFSSSVPLCPRRFGAPLGGRG